MTRTASSAMVRHHTLIMWHTNASPHARLGMLATMTRTASSARVTHHTLIMWHTYASPNAQKVQLDMLIPTNVSRARTASLPIMTPKNALLQERTVQQALLPMMATTIVTTRARMKKLGCFLTMQRTTTIMQLAA